VIEALALAFPAVGIVWAVCWYLKHTGGLEGRDPPAPLTPPSAPQPMQQNSLPDDRGAIRIVGPDQADVYRQRILEQQEYLPVDRYFPVLDPAQADKILVERKTGYDAGLKVGYSSGYKDGMIKQKQLGCPCLQSECAPTEGGQVQPVASCCLKAWREQGRRLRAMRATCPYCTRTDPHQHHDGWRE
jgi:hypothetical protein